MQGGFRFASCNVCDRFILHAAAVILRCSTNAGGERDPQLRVQPTMVESQHPTNQLSTRTSQAQRCRESSPQCGGPPLFSRLLLNNAGVRRCLANPLLRAATQLGPGSAGSSWILAHRHATSSATPHYSVAAFCHSNALIKRRDAALHRRVNAAQPGRGGGS
jgi:hypothetical protein